jgi:hypothetical protein
MMDERSVTGAFADLCDDSRHRRIVVNDEDSGHVVGGEEALTPESSQK